jgi:GIY-YIG catalytic domain
MVSSCSKSYSFTQLGIFLNVPSKSGIYLLHNSSRCIYIGESTNLRKALQEHFRGDTPWITVWNPTGFSFELCSENVRTARKAQLIDELLPIITNAHSSDERVLNQPL